MISPKVSIARSELSCQGLPSFRQVQLPKRRAVSINATPIELPG